MKTYEATEQAYKNGYDNGYEDGKRDARKKGRWKRVYEDSLGWVDRCSQCKEVEENPKYYCPNCGADMRGGEDG